MTVGNLKGQPGSETLPAAAVSPLSLATVLANYQDSIAGLANEETSLLALLFTRDQVDSLLHDDHTPTPAEAQQLVLLDAPICMTKHNGGIIVMTIWVL